MSQMKSVGIVTIEDYVNYGNRLQNYALTKLLESEGFGVVNGLCIYTKQDYVLTSGNTLKKIVKKLIPFAWLRNKITPRKTQRLGLLREREKKFAAFVASYTKPHDPIVAKTYQQAVRQLSTYGVTYCIAGSDQVWHPYYQGRNDQFLTFMPKSKRLSFAASIGTDSIPEEKKARYRKNLSEMKYLSVREQRAVEIIKELTGRDADLTLDPTLLLEAEQWQQAVKKPNSALEAEYICTYFLGETPEAVKVFAQEKGLPVYALNSEEHPELFVLDPGEFLYMIQHAAYVLTDSFHAVAFSIKFHREFYVFDRKEEGVASMFSRIETITKRFGLENRIQSRDAVMMQPPMTHWDAIDQELLVEKKKSMSRLLEAMETT